LSSTDRRPNTPAELEAYGPGVLINSSQADAALDLFTYASASAIARFWTNSQDMVSLAPVVFLVNEIFAPGLDQPARVDAVLTLVEFYRGKLPHGRLKPNLFERLLFARPFGITERQRRAALVYLDCLRTFGDGRVRWRPMDHLSKYIVTYETARGFFLATRRRVGLIREVIIREQLARRELDAAQPVSIGPLCRNISHVIVDEALQRFFGNLMAGNFQYCFEVAHVLGKARINFKSRSPVQCRESAFHRVYIDRTFAADDGVDAALDDALLWFSKNYGYELVDDMLTIYKLE